jgi:hypothetical protein
MAQKKKWSEHNTKKFVEMYEQQEVLWNFKLPDYKNKDFQRTSEVVLAEACNVSVKEVKKQDQDFAKYMCARKGKGNWFKENWYIARQADTHLVECGRQISK